MRGFRVTFAFIGDFFADVFYRRQGWTWALKPRYGKTLAGVEFGWLFVWMAFEWR